MSCLRLRSRHCLLLVLAASVWADGRSYVRREDADQLIRSLELQTTIPRLPVLVAASQLNPAALISRSVLLSIHINHPGTLFQLTSSDHIVIRPRTIMSQEHISHTLGPHSRLQNRLTLVQKSVTASIIALGKVELDSRRDIREGGNKVSDITVCSSLKRSRCRSGSYTRNSDGGNGT